MTTTDDVVWWLRQRVRDRGMTTWFQPSVNRVGADDDGWTSGVIQRGDMLWTDFGVVAMGLKTDTQHNGYVMREGETVVPAGIQQCLKTTNRLQDILMDSSDSRNAVHDVAPKGL